MSLFDLDAATGIATQPPACLRALVIAFYAGPSHKLELGATIVHASAALLEDIQEALSGDLEACSSIGSPPRAGIWIWEGNIVWGKPSYHGEYDDPEYIGTYREVLDEELAQLRSGVALSWFIEEDPDADLDSTPGSEA